MLIEGKPQYVQGSGAKPYELKNTGGVLSCSCPAWRNQSAPINKRTCKHLKKLLGEAAELARVNGKPTPTQAASPVAAPTEPAKGAPPVLLAHKFDEDDVDPTGWWVSEKLDGVRAYWDGGNFVSRLGNTFHAPAWFKEGLPAHPLDGELWMGRKQFQQTVSVVRSDDAGERWRDVEYVVFDAPAIAGTFEERQAYLLSKFGPDLKPAPYMRVLAQERVASRRALAVRMKAVVAAGGEGLMLRKPGSKYEVGRSHTCLKVKPFVDAEARVVGHEPGEGKHAGRLGALVCEAGGKTFNVGTGFSDAERKTPPPLGAVVTYRYTELTEGGAPRFPRFVAVRDYE